MVDAKDSFFLLTAQFKCPNSECNTLFLLTIPECMAQFPLEITSTFPAVLTHRSAVSRFIADELSMMVDHAVGPGQLARIIQERHTREHTERELAYYAVCYSVVKKRRDCRVDGDQRGVMGIYLFFLSPGSSLPLFSPLFLSLFFQVSRGFRIIRGPFWAHQS